MVFNPEIEHIKVIGLLWLGLRPRLHLRCLDLLADIEVAILDALDGTLSVWDCLTHIECLLDTQPPLPLLFSALVLHLAQILRLELLLFEPERILRDGLGQALRVLSLLRGRI